VEYSQSPAVEAAVDSPISFGKLFQFEKAVMAAIHSPQQIHPKEDLPYLEKARERNPFLFFLGKLLERFAQ